jgi:hypothetical protein
LELERRGNARPGRARAPGRRPSRTADGRTSNAHCPPSKGAVRLGTAFSSGKGARFKAETPRQVSSQRQEASARGNVPVRGRSQGENGTRSGGDYVRASAHRPGTPHCDRIPMHCSLRAGRPSACQDRSKVRRLRAPALFKLPDHGQDGWAPDSTRGFLFGESISFRRVGVRAPGRCWPTFPGVSRDTLANSAGRRGSR